MSQEKQAYLVLEQTLAYEEAFWKENSKIKWDVEGDRNTSYFHKLAKVKKATKGISSLRVRDTFFLTNQMDISNHVVVHFNNLFNSTSYFVCVGNWSDNWSGV